MTALCPIVAVGASAGGLAPTVELLRELGPSPRVAIVVIHHLDPTHDSGLVEILARGTSMPVTKAQDGEAVQPNHVYVVPPNAGLLMDNGTLKVVPRDESTGLHLPIDRFFESLARDRNSLAVGVVLSGTGFDGTAGIQAIKAEGGIALAQDATAEYASMPQSAIATGCVDFILPPGRLARELLRFGAHPAVAHSQEPKDPDEAEYQQILAALRKDSGVDFACYKHTTIRRRLQRRLLLHGLTELSDYVALLKREPREVRALCEEVLIHVTGFFREPEAFASMVESVLPKVYSSRSRDAPLRVWVPGCSTGEEVYSIAICLLEYLGATSADVPIKIFGTDLSLATVERARSGSYPSSIERDVSESRLQRFFTKYEGGYRIRRDVRDLCVFAKHDVTRDPPFSAMDLISCRNLMIYLSSELQDRVIALLHYALKEPGFLLLGSSETVRAFPGFAVVDGKNKIYARTSAAPRLAFDFTSPRVLHDFNAGAGAAGFPERTAGARSSAAADVHREADRLVLAGFAPPGVVVTDDLSVVQFRGQTGTFLEPAPGVASLDLLRLAREELRLPLRRAIDEARLTQTTVRVEKINLTTGDTLRNVTLEVLPFSVHATQQRFFVVLFEDVTPPDDDGVKRLAATTAVADAASTDQQLRQELASTRQYLESVIEQLEAANEELKAANEEIVSSNEELRSTNEELQSAKEELQATNEELRTVNDEMVERNIEATRLSDDLTNVLSSVEIPILILGRDSRLRRFTPAAAKLFGCAMSDVGRMFNELKHVETMAPALSRMIPDVLAHLRPMESAIQDETGHWYQVSVRPYVTLDGRIDGTVVAAFDVDAVKRGAEHLAAARKYAESIVDTVRESLVVLDRDLCVRSANKAFQRAFRVDPRDIEGRPLGEIVRGELGSPTLHDAIAKLSNGATVEDFRLEQRDRSGRRVFILNARHIEGTQLLLLALEDVTDAERAAQAAQQAEIRFRDVLTEAAEGVLMIDPSGRVLFANRMAKELFGYAAEELTNLSVEHLVPELAGPSAASMGRGRPMVGFRKDKTEFPAEIAVSSVAREDGPVLVAFVTDVTERRESEKKIREYQGKLQRMVFDAALTEERERRRIAVELHDRIGQALALAEIKLTSVRTDVSGAPRDAIDTAVDLLKQAINDKRTLVFELSPPVLYDLGLEEALSWLAEDVEKRHGIHVLIDDDGVAKPLDDGAKALVFRAVRELLMNVLKHAKTQEAKVSLNRADNQLDITVEDGGVGFEREPTTDRPSGEGFGLLSIREQIGRLGGTLHIESVPQNGTVVRVRVPLRISEAKP